jgi:hypothetical protein
MFEVDGSQVYGRYFRQDYDLHGGKAAGRYANGNIAAVENTSGQGRTLLMGSFPGAGYYLHHGAATRELFMSFLKMQVSRHSSPLTTMRCRPGCIKDPAGPFSGRRTRRAQRRR